MYETAIQLRRRLKNRLSHLPDSRRRAVIRRIIRDLRDVLQPIDKPQRRIEDEPEMTREERVCNQMDHYSQDPDYQNYLKMLNEADTYGSRSCSL